MADPGFPIEGEGADLLGGADLQCIRFSAKTCAKMKELDPVGGGAGQCVKELGKGPKKALQIASCGH